MLPLFARFFVDKPPSQGFFYLYVNHLLLLICLKLKILSDHRFIPVHTIPSAFCTAGTVSQFMKSLVELSTLLCLQNNSGWAEFVKKDISAELFSPCFGGGTLIVRQVPCIKSNGQPSHSNLLLKMDQWQSSFLNQQDFKGS